MSARLQRVTAQRIMNGFGCGQPGVMMDVEVCAFGPMELVRGPVEIRIGSRRQQVLLAMLVIRRGGVLPMGTLAEALWPVRRPAKVERSLQIHVHRLRRALGEVSAVRHQPPGYALGLPRASVDVYRFEELVQRGRAALVDADHLAAAELFGQAVALYRGPAFQGLEYLDEIAGESQRLAELRLVSLEDRFTAELALDRGNELVPELTALVAEHPLRERFRVLLMTALYRDGRKADALAAYRQGRAVLRAELGVEPSAECQALERAILVDDPVLRQPEPVAAGQSAPPPPQQLPALPGFTGRVRQLRRLDEWAAGSQPAAGPVWLVEGSAGVGKTALAVHWAHQRADRFPDGQLYVNLRGYDLRSPLEPLPVLSGFLRALGLPAKAVPTELAEAGVAYRNRLAGRRVLVLLDNAASAEQVRPLLPGGGGNLALVTSRDRLTGLADQERARRLVLEVLPDGEARALLAGILGERRVLADPAAVTELVQLCAGVPLALRIAAANLGTRSTLTIADYLARLRDVGRLAGLAVAGDDHASVRATFDLSYQRLAGPAQRIFRLLGLAPGPDLSHQSAAALAGVPVERAGRELAALAAAHLVEEPVPGRYACHDLLRAYARELVHLEPGADRQAALARLYAHYWGTARAASELLYPHVVRIPGPPEPDPPATRFPDQVAAVRWLDAELPNLVAVVRSAAAVESGDRSAAWLLADALRSYLLQRGPLAHAELVAAAGLVAAEASGEPHAYGCALLGRAGLRYLQGRSQPAIDDLTRARAAFREVGWVAGEASLVANLGSIYMELGDLPAALAHHTEALALHERTGSRYGQAGVLGNLAMQLQLLGRLAEAADHGQRALAAVAGLGADKREATNLGNLAETRRLQGEYGAAQLLYGQAQSRYRAIGDRSGEARTLLGLGVIYGETGRPEPARGLIRAALRQVRQTGHRAYEAAALIGLAQLHRWDAEPVLAARAGRRARDLAAAIGYRYLHAEAAIELAELGPDLAPGELAPGELAPGELAPGGPAPDELARASLDQALELTRQAGYRLQEGRALTASASLRLAAGAFDLAIEEGERALAIHQETGHRPGAAAAHRLLARVRRRTGDLAAGRAHAERAAALSAELGIPRQDS